MAERAGRGGSVRKSALVAVIVLLVEATAGAAPRKDDEARAFELFGRGEESYRAGRFVESATLLRQAYELSHAPILQYNLGRALEGAGDLKGAIASYRLYLASPGKITDRQSIEQRIVTLVKTIADKETLEERLARERAESAAQLEAARLEAARRVEEARASERPMSRARVAAPWIVASIGGLGLVAGGAVAGVAESRHHAAESSASGTSAAEEQSSAHRLALGANIAFGVSGAVAAVGIIWGVVDAAHRARRARAR